MDYSYLSIENLVSMFWDEKRAYNNAKYDLETLEGCLIEGVFHVQQDEIDHADRCLRVREVKVKNLLRELLKRKQVYTHCITIDNLMRQVEILYSGHYGF